MAWAWQGSSALRQHLASTWSQESPRSHDQGSEGSEAQRFQGLRGLRGLRRLRGLRGLRGLRALPRSNSHLHEGPTRSSIPRDIKASTPGSNILLIQSKPLLLSPCSSYDLLSLCSGCLSLCLPSHLSLAGHLVYGPLCPVRQQRPYFLLLAFPAQHSGFYYNLLSSSTAGYESCSAPVTSC